MKNAGLCTTCGMLRDEGGECGIGRHVIGLRQQRRVEPQDLGDRRRVLIEDFPEALAGLPRVPLVDWGGWTGAAGACVGAGLGCARRAGDTPLSRAVNHIVRVSVRSVFEVRVNITFLLRGPGREVHRRSDRTQ